jgi:hypothetical protein
MELITNGYAAQLPVHLDAGIRLYVDEYVGDRADVRSTDLLYTANVDPDHTNDIHRTSYYGLTNGGTAGLIWGYLVVWIGYMMVFASIAEMASM